MYPGIKARSVYVKLSWDAFYVDYRIYSVGAGLKKKKRKKKMSSHRQKEIIVDIQLPAFNEKHQDCESHRV